MYTRTHAHTHACTHARMHTHTHTHTHKQAQSVQSTAHSALDIVQCHPGYAFSLSSSACVCRRGEIYEYQFVCARNGRYFYVPVSVSMYIQWRGCLAAEVLLVHHIMSLWKLKRYFYVCRGKWYFCGGGAFGRLYHWSPLLLLTLAIDS